MQTSKIESYIGIGLVIVVVIAFVLQILLNLPKQADVTTKAKVVQEIPSDLFSTSNPTNKQVQQLNVPNNVPVSIGGSDIGRDNVFSNY